MTWQPIADLLGKNGAFSGRGAHVPERAENPLSATAEEVWQGDMLDIINLEVMPRLGDLEDFLIHLENQLATKNKGNRNYRPWFPISMKRPGNDLYIPAFKEIRERLEELREDLLERAGEEGEEE